MKTNLKDLLKHSGQSLDRKQGTLKIIAALKVPEPDDECLQRLQSLGLSIDRIIKNKIVGSIQAKKLADLRKDPQVEEVEVSVRLKSHS